MGAVLRPPANTDATVAQPLNHLTTSLHILLAPAGSDHVGSLVWSAPCRVPWQWPAVQRWPGPGPASIMWWSPLVTSGRCQAASQAATLLPHTASWSPVHTTTVTVTSLIPYWHHHLTLTSILNTLNCVQLIFLVIGTSKLWTWPFLYKAASWWHSNHSLYNTT